MKSTETARAKSSSGAAALDASAVFGSIFPHWETASYSGGVQECRDGLLVGSTIGGISDPCQWLAEVQSSAANADGTGWSGPIRGGTCREPYRVPP
jgi:hypothetical protein